MKLRLKRIAKKATYTIGRLYINDVYFCDTIEDRDRGLTNSMSSLEVSKKKVYGETAIPTGTYLVQLTYSPKFAKYSWCKNGLVPAVLNVPGFDGIRIHPGNTAKDSLGCILVGENKQIGKVLNSQKWYKALFEKLSAVNHEQIKLTIE